MNSILFMILKLSVFGSVLTGILFMLKPLVKNRISKSVLYYLWIIVLLRLCLPFGFILTAPAGWFGVESAETAKTSQTDLDPVYGASSAAETDEDVFGTQTFVQSPEAQPDSASANPEAGGYISNDYDAPPKSSVFSALATLLKNANTWFVIWAAGALLCAAWYVFGYIRFAGMIRSAAAQADSADLAVFNSFPESGRVRFLRCQFVRTPMLIGILHPTLAVPLVDYSRNGMEQCLRDILRHEFVHYRRRDILYKWFAMSVTCLHWFNPLTIPLRREISRACELACDEAVIGVLTPKEKQHYGETLLSLAVNQALPMGILATTMGEEKAQLKERLVSIMNHKVRNLSAVLMSAVIMLGLFGCAAINGIEKAETIQTIDAQQAMDSLQESLIISRENGRVKLTFTIPDYSSAEDFNICISGQVNTDSGVTDYRAFDELAGKWEAGETYNFEPEIWNDFTDIIFTAALNDAQPLEIDLIAFYRRTFDVTLYEKYDLTIAIPNEYIDRLLIFTEPKYEQYEDSYLISVYEKQSYEESRADWGGEDGGGFLFGICRYTRSQYESYLSSDGSGLSFFAKDETYYYGHTFATDVQFYRSDIESYNEDVFAPWTELSEQVDGILSDFVSRNGLAPYSDSEFWGRDFSYDGRHMYVTYFPYYAVNGGRNSTNTLVLSQPAKQGEGGIWCVERWYDNDYGNMYCYFPSWNDGTDLAAEEYYAKLQMECDGGQKTELLDPMQAAMEFAEEHFEHTPVPDSFAVIDGKPAGNVLRLCNQVFGDMGSLQAAVLDLDGTKTQLDKQEMPDYYDRPFSSYTGSRLYPIIWLKSERPASISGNVVYCRNADETKMLAFYEQESLLCVNVDGTEQWFTPAYSYNPSPYDRMISFCEEFSG